MKRKLQRVYFYLLKFLITRLAYIDSRRYMRYYNWLLRKMGLTIHGEARFIALSVKFDDFDLITIGDRLVASMNVRFLTHDYSYTTALISIGEKPQTDIGTLGRITVGENVFIGMNTILLPGTTIGNHCIIGAGSVVRGTIPNYSVVSGNPAQVVGDIRQHAEKMKSKDYMRHIDKK